MDFLYSDDPIVACSTGNTSNCAIAVIRFSGFDQPEIFKQFFTLNFDNIKPRHAYYCDLIKGEELVDQVVATFYKGPHSYNGENILELAVHGNMLNVDRIVRMFCDTKLFRHAHPGEFSYRALKNKKLNLSQIEGLDLLLNANSSFSLDQGFSLMSGKLQESYLRLQKSFLNHRSSVEFSMDFYEDMGEEQAQRQLKDSLKVFAQELDLLYHRVKGDSSKLLNPEILLLGQPNSGKSTLFNHIVRDDRSIVTSIAGTTRDYITEDVNIEGVLYRLIDTAGLRESSDVIEMEGVRRSLSLADRAFFKVLLVNPFAFDFDYFESVKNIPFDLVIYTHADKPGYKSELAKLLSSADFERFLANNYSSGPMGAAKSGPMGATKSGPMGATKSGPMGATKSGPMGATKSGPMGATKSGSIGAQKSGSIGAIFEQKSEFEYICSLEGENSTFLKVFEQFVNNKYLSLARDEPILLQRHKQKILESKNLLDNYMQLIEIESDISIISSELNNIGHCISELIGIISPDDVLHNIFDNFCIGK